MNGASSLVSQLGGVNWRQAFCELMRIASFLQNRNIGGQAGGEGAEDNEEVRALRRLKGSQTGELVWYGNHSHR